MKLRDFETHCEKEFDSFKEMVAINGKGNRSPRHFCEECSKK